MILEIAHLRKSRTIFSDLLKVFYDLAWGFLELF